MKLGTLKINDNDYIINIVHDCINPAIGEQPETKRIVLTSSEEFTLQINDEVQLDYDDSIHDLIVSEIEFDIDKSITTMVLIH